MSKKVAKPKGYTIGVIRRRLRFVEDQLCRAPALRREQVLLINYLVLFPREAT